MATISRGIKSGTGTTEYEDGDTILASELNTDLNTIVNEINGALDDANIQAGADIDPGKINDYSADATESRTKTDPGISGGQFYATSLEGELERLRYTIQQIATGVGTDYNNGTTTADVYYGDYPARGPNLIANPSFEVKSNTSGTAAPDRWSLVGTPSAISQQTTSTAFGVGKAIRVVADAANEGLSQTVSGLKASTHYLVSARVKVNAVGDIASLTTTNADSAGNFRDLALTTSSTTGTVLHGVIKTDSSATGIVVSLLTVANGDSVDWDDVQFVECNPNPFSSKGYVAVRDTSSDTTVGDVTTVDRAFPFSDALSAAVTVPGPGYTIRVTARLSVKSGATQTFYGSLYENDGGGAVLHERGDIAFADANYGGSLTLSYIQVAPTPGSTYTYTVNGSVNTSTATPNDSNGGPTDQNSTLTVELIPQH